MLRQGILHVEQVGHGSLEEQQLGLPVLLAHPFPLEIQEEELSR